MSSILKLKNNLLIQLTKTLNKPQLQPRNITQRPSKQKSSKNGVNLTTGNLRKIYKSVETSKRQVMTKRKGGDQNMDYSCFFKDIIEESSRNNEVQKIRTNSINRFDQNQTPSKQNKCEIVLHQNGSKKKFYYQVEKVKDLISFLKQKQKNDSVLTYCTIPTNLTHDFYLTKQDHDGSFFNKKTLHLRPYHKSNKPSRVTIRSFEIIKCIGQGGFSKVYLVKFKEDGKFYAMKMIEKSFILGNKKQEIVRNQRNVMVEMENHPFIIPLKFAFESTDYIIFVVQYCPGGQLFTYVKKYKRMSQQVAKFFIIEVLMGIQHLHEKNIIYRDIKPENILLDLDGHVRIADLGLAKPGIQQKDKSYSFCGSPEYMAPQMILKIGHGRSVDYYCVGALLYQLLIGLPPFYNKNPQIIYESVLKQQLTFPKHTALSLDCKKLLKGLLQKDPRRRMGNISGVKQIVAHPWFGRINRRQVYEKRSIPPIEIDNVQNLMFVESDLEKKREDNDGDLQRVLYQQREGLSVFKRVMGDGFYYDYRKEQGNSLQGILHNPLHLRSNNQARSRDFQKSTSRRSEANFRIDSGRLSSQRLRNIPKIKNPYIFKKCSDENITLKEINMSGTHQSRRRLKKNATMKTFANLTLRNRDVNQDG